MSFSVNPSHPKCQSSCLQTATAGFWLYFFSLLFVAIEPFFLVVQSVYTVVTFNPSHPLKILRWCSTHALTTNKEYLNFLNSPNLFLGNPWIMFTSLLIKSGFSRLEFYFRFAFPPRFEVAKFPNGRRFNPHVLYSYGSPAKF